MPRLSHAATGSALFATLLLGACGGGDSGTPTPSSSAPSLVSLNDESQYAAAAVAILMPMQVLSVSGDFVQLPQEQTVASVTAKRAMAAVRSSQPTMGMVDTGTELERDVEACGAGGEVVIETQGDAATVWYKGCREVQTGADGTVFNTEQNGWARYTALSSETFDEAYAIEEDTTFRVTGDSATTYVEHLQTRMRYFQQDQRLRLEDVDYTFTDQGTYGGQAYNYTQAAQKLAFTSDPQTGVTFAGRVGGWGRYFNGDEMMNGLLDVASAAALFFDDQGIPKAGTVAVNGAGGTKALVEMRSKGYSLQLNGTPSLDIVWQDQ